MEPLVIQAGGRTLILEDTEAAMTVRLHTNSKRTAALINAEQEEALLGWLLERHARRSTQRPVKVRRDCCEVCKDDPAGQRWLCPNLENHEIVREEMPSADRA